MSYMWERYVCPHYRRPSIELYQGVIIMKVKTSCGTEDCKHGYHKFAQTYPAKFSEKVKRFLSNERICVKCGKVFYV